MEIPLPDGEITPEKLDEIVERFHANYEREYTYRLEAPAEMVCYHVVAFAEVDKLKPEPRPRTGKDLQETVKEVRTVDFIDAGVHQATIYNGDALEPGMEFSGPAVIEESGTTVVIPPGFPCSVDDYGNYIIGIQS